MSIKTRLLPILPFCFLVLTFGCQPKNPATAASVNGKVTLGGQPVTAGTVTFHTGKDDGKMDTGIGPDGTYSMAQRPVGDFTVTVETESVNPEKKQQVYGGGKGKGMPMSQPPPGFEKPKGTYTKIPEKYTKKETTPFKVSLKPGNQTFNLEMTQ
jgi:hypothetical protein